MLLEKYSLETRNGPSGRGLHVKNFIKAGTCVFNEAAIASVSLAVHMDVCVQCLKPTMEKWVKCACGSIYCCQNCLEQDLSLHRITCGVTTDPDLILLVRLQNKKSLIPHDIISNIDCRDQRELEQKALQVSILPMLDMNDGVDWLCRFECNNYTLHDQNCFVYGQGVYIYASVMNHSCAPNVVCQFFGDVMQVRAIQDLQPGQEIRVSYLDLVKSKEERALELSQRYFFECSCDRCKSPEPALDKEYLTLICTQMNKMIEMGNWILAARCSKSVLDVYVKRYPKYHPILGVHALLTAKCHWNANLVNEAWDIICLAYDSIVISHGPGTLLDEVDQMKRVISKEL